MNVEWMCGACGSLGDPGDRFCGVCGTARPAPEEVLGLEDTRDPIGETVVVPSSGWPASADGDAGPAAGAGLDDPSLRTVIRERVAVEYEVGSVVNGHRFNGVAWVPVEPAEPAVAEERAGTAYEVGSVVNGHRFNGVAWVPVEPVEPAEPAVAEERADAVYEVGSVVNGHRFNGVEWVPVEPAEPVEPEVSDPSAEQAGAEEQPDAVYEVGSVVNGHRFNGVEWVPVEPAVEAPEPTVAAGPPSPPAPTDRDDAVPFEVGAIVNGHRFNGVEWLPAAPPPPLNAIPAPPPAPADGSVPALGARRRRWRTWLFGGTALAVAMGGGWVAYDRTRFHVSTPGGELSDASGGLRIVEKAWRAAMPSDHVSVSDDAGCWYALEDGDLFTGRVACGGARVVGTAEGQTWWEMSAEPSEDGDQVQVSHDAVYLAAGPEARPSGVRLVDASGDGPSAAVDDVEPPELPRADPGLVIHDFYPDTTGMEQLTLGAESEIHLPAGTLRVRTITPLPSAPLGEVEEGGVDEWTYLEAVQAPATGEEFRLLEWTFTPYSEELETFGVDAGVAVTEVTVNDGDAVLADFTSLSDWSSGGSTLVSAPADAFLRLETDGVVETLDLATGATRTNPDSAVYERNWWQAPARTLRQSSDVVSTRVPGEGISRWQAGRELVIEEVALVPYLARDRVDGVGGWAGQGMAWLTLSITTRNSWVDDLSGPGLESYTNSVTDVWTVEVDGAAYGPVEQAAGVTGDDHYLVAVMVPASTTAARLAVATKETFDLYRGAFVRNDQAASYPPVWYDVGFAAAPH